MHPQPHNAPAAAANPASLSPGLRSGLLAADGSQHWAPAFELKFLLAEPDAQRLETALAPRLAPDPHADPALVGCYRITTLYLDTPALDVLHKIGRHRYRKFRVRCYGVAAAAESAHLERKTARNGQVRKRRITIGAEALPLLSPEPAPPSAPPTWGPEPEWFRRQVAARALRPACLVTYLRRAYVCPHGSGARLTFDRQVLAAAADGWSLSAEPRSPVRLVDGDEPLVVCELKHVGPLPAAFKQTLADLGLVPAGVSKYRRAMRSLGLAPAPGPATEPRDA